MANLIVVRASTELCRLAAQISGFILADEALVLLALGTGSVFVAVTAIGVARFQLASDYPAVVFVRESCDLEDEGHQRSALRVFADWPGRRFARWRDLPTAS